MATTGQNFVRLTVAALIGATVAAIGKVFACNPNNAAQIVNGGTGAILDKVTIDFSADAFAKHGAATVALSGTTAKTIDLTDLTSITDSYDGDTTFATFSQLVIKNLGPGSITVAPGASNPASLGLNGTTPTITVGAGQTFTLSYAATVVDGTHKTILLTPAATTVVSVGVEGS